MNRNIRHTILFSMLGGLALSAGTWAQGVDMFAQMDSNHDGRISAQEHAAGTQAMFVRMDANHDGKVTADEMRAGHRMMMHGDHDMGHAGMQDHAMEHAGMHGDMMARMDTNHDGVLTAAENMAAAQARFARMDSNHDGKVTAAEMEAAHKMMRGEHGMDDHDMADHDMDGHRMDDHDMKMGAGHDMHDRMRMGDMRAMMDANHDGVITAAEHAAGAQAMFMRMDSNHDGYLSKGEMEAGHAMPKSP